MRRGYTRLRGERELWRGRQWVVTTHGIQGLDRWFYYFISHGILRKDENSELLLARAYGRQEAAT